MAIVYRCAMQVLAAQAELSCVDELPADDRNARIAAVRVWRVEVAAAADRARQRGAPLSLFDAEAGAGGRRRRAAITR